MLISVQRAAKFVGASALALALMACHESDRPTRFDPALPRSSGVEAPAGRQIKPVVPDRGADGNDKVTTAGTSADSSSSLAQRN